jgi:hypothetical protein
MLKMLGLLEAWGTPRAQRLALRAECGGVRSAIVRHSATSGIRRQVAGKREGKRAPAWRIRGLTDQSVFWAIMLADR